MGANSLKSGLKGPNHLVMKDGTHYLYNIPEFKLGGTVIGERTVNIVGSFTFLDLTNNLKAVIVMSTYKKSGFWKKTETGCLDEFKGVIYHADLENIYEPWNEEVKDLSKLKDVENHICEISGSWLSNMVLDGKTYWDINEHIPARLVPELNELALPSDWRYRDDILWLKYKFLKIAHKWKLKMEEQQRSDRKIRLKRNKERGIK
jgi:hypothetical protein